MRDAGAVSSEVARCAREREGSGGSSSTVPVARSTASACRQAFTAGNVDVERGSSRIEGGCDAAHRDCVQTIGLQDCQGCVDDRVLAERCLRRAVTRRALTGVRGSSVVDHRHALADRTLVDAYTVRHVHCSLRTVYGNRTLDEVASMPVQEDLMDTAPVRDRPP